MASSSTNIAYRDTITIPTTSPQSQSFSRSYGPILPTSLIYIILSTRGCSPWRPDAVMGTIGNGIKALPRFFKDRHKRTGHFVEQSAHPESKPLLQIIWFRGEQSVKKKRQRFPGLISAVRVRLCYHILSISRLRNSNLIPFRAMKQSSVYRN